MNNQRRPAALYVLSEDGFNKIYSPDQQERLAGLLDLQAPLLTPLDAETHPEKLQTVEVILSGWGAPRMDEKFLAHTPNLQAVFYGAGSIRGMVTDAFWQRGILVTSAYAANAVPVAAITLGQILLALKRILPQTRAMYNATGPDMWCRQESPGGYGTTVGLIGLGMIGRKVAHLLKPFDVHILAYDPYLQPEEAAKLHIETTSLEDLFRRSHVVSLHAPNLPATHGMITGALLASMPPQASFINTARGALVRENELIAILRDRPDLSAILDVTDPEPPVANSPLYKLPNVFLTPHAAGSTGQECHRLGELVVEECRRYVNGLPPCWPITREQVENMA